MKIKNTIAVHFEKQDDYTEKHYSEENHLSGFTLHRDTREGALQGTISYLKHKRDFTTIIYMFYSKDIPEEWNEPLKKFHDFLCSVDKKIIDLLIDKSNNFYFTLGVANEEDCGTKHKDDYYIQVPESYPSIFKIKEFRVILEEQKNITYNFCYCDEHETVLYLKDLKKETLQKIFENILLLRSINKNIAIDEEQAAKYFCDRNLPWNLIK